MHLLHVSSPSHGSLCARTHTLRTTTHTHTHTPTPTPTHTRAHPSPGPPRRHLDLETDDASALQFLGPELSEADSMLPSPLRDLGYLAQSGQQLLEGVARGRRGSHSTVAALIVYRAAAPAHGRTPRGARPITPHGKRGGARADRDPPRSRCRPHPRVYLQEHPISEGKST
jgi:hypothetical protein